MRHRGQRRRERSWRPAELSLFLAVMLAPHGTSALPADDLVATPDAREPVASQSGPDSVTSLARGHWVELRGSLDEAGDFIATRVELQSAGRREIWWGTPVAGLDDHGRFTLLGRTVQTTERTRWDGIESAALGGHRVKVVGDVLGQRLIAQRIAARRPGISRIEGRIDRVRREHGTIELTVASFRVVLPATLALRIDDEADRRQRTVSRSSRGATIYFGADDDDILGPGYRLSDRLGVAMQQEISSRDEDEFDLDPESDRDRNDQVYRLRSRLRWQPSWRLGLVAEAKYRYRERDRNDRSTSTDSRLQLGEAYLIARDLGPGLDLQVGRQDFDEPREWLYDQNLDAVRLIRRRGRVNLELSASTTLSDGNARDESADNLVLYVSNLYARRHLAAYVVHRRFDLAGLPERRTHVGVRALGEFVPGVDSWLELSHLSGDRLGTRLDGWGADLGAVIEPERFGPIRLIVGYAFGSGDDGSGSDSTFRQTGLQDNDAFLSGVTSFRYYGELMDPELANLEIATFGLGVRARRNLSFELVGHRYRQARASRQLISTDLRGTPDGVSRDLGFELDLIAGARVGAHWRFEAVAATFSEGSAFPDGNSADLFKLQLRYRH